jgi:hypothetical protein
MLHNMAWSYAISLCVGAMRAPAGCSGGCGPFLNGQTTDEGRGMGIAFSAAVALSMTNVTPDAEKTSAAIAQPSQPQTKSKKSARFARAILYSRESRPFEARRVFKTASSEKCTRPPRTISSSE